MVRKNRRVRGSAGGSRSSRRRQRRLLHPARARQPGGCLETVLDALCTALQLDDRACPPLRPRPFFPAERSPAPPLDEADVRPSVQWLLDSITGSAAIAENGRLDALATNQLGRAFHAHLFDGSGRPVNFARFVFSTRAPRTFPRRLGARRQRRDRLLRLEAGRNPFDRALSDLVGELSTRRRVQPPLGDSRRAPSPKGSPARPPRRRLELSFNRIDVAADPGLMIVTYTAEPGSRSEEALRLLASWTASRGRTRRSSRSERSTTAVRPNDSPTAHPATGLQRAEDLYLSAASAADAGRVACKGVR